MPFNLFGFLSNILIEAYAFELLFLLVIHSFIPVIRKNLSGLLIAFNFLGLLLALMVLSFEVFELVRLRNHNYDKISMQSTPYWYFFRYLAIAAVSSAIIVFFSKNRRRSISWTLAGMVLLILPFLSRPFEGYLNTSSIGTGYFIPWQLYVFSDVDIWSKLLVLAIPLCVVFIIWRVMGKLGFA